jgi:hypothetical protein
MSIKFGPRHIDGEYREFEEAFSEKFRSECPEGEPGGPLQNLFLTIKNCPPQDYKRNAGAGYLGRRLRGDEGSIL